MKVRLVCYEEVDRWIMGKFALRMRDNLQQLQIETDIAMQVDPAADINHHIVFEGYEPGSAPSSRHTLMITHVDDIRKLELIKEQLKTAAAGVCMSRETQQQLAQLGADKNRLCYINPAHDGVVTIRKHRIGICCRVQEDGRKREYFIDKLAKRLDPAYFKFVIMGDSWEPQVATLQKNGFEVDYTNRFIYNQYVELIPTLDYYLYMGMDEGQMGFIDALAAGVKTIVTAQGYHLDAPNGIVHPYTSYEELEAIFLQLEAEKRKLVDAVATWNWMDYTIKHVQIWNHLLGNQEQPSQFADGLNSLLNMQQSELQVDHSFVDAKRKELTQNKFRRSYYHKTGRLKRTYRTEGIAGVIRLVTSKFF